MARAILLTLVALLLALPVAAHDLSITDTLVLIKANGAYQLDLECELDSLALGVDPTVSAREATLALRGLPEAERRQKIDALRELFRRRVRLRFDGLPVDPRVSFPGLEEPRQDLVVAPLLGTTARLTGRVPADAQSFTLTLSRGFPPAVLTVLDQRSAAGVTLPLEQGVESPAFPLDGSLGKGKAQGESGGPLGGAAIALRYVVLGFEHILPKGLDHILFILGLFLLSRRLSPLLWQVTAFTAAHTLTLGLAMSGLVSVPGRVVEPLIALSIAYVAVENLLTQELKPWRPVVVFCFGLLHGLGFAGVLAQLGFPQDRFWPALLSFNAGVELGQMTVLAGAFLLLGWWRQRSWYRPWVAVPLCLLIAACGLFWAVQRTVG